MLDCLVPTYPSPRVRGIIVNLTGTLTNSCLQFSLTLLPLCEQWPHTALPEHERCISPCLQFPSSLSPHPDSTSCLLVRVCYREGGAGTLIDHCIKTALPSATNTGREQSIARFATQNKKEMEEKDRVEVVGDERLYYHRVTEWNNYASLR